MCSSSTASTTAPRAAARSVSRMRAAPSSAAAAARSERSRCPATCWWIVTNSPAPSSTRTSVSTPAYHAVSWRRSRARGCITGLSSSEPVTRAAQRGDQLGLEPIVDLSTQPPDQDVQEVGEGIVVVVPHMCGDGSAVEHLARPAEEQLQQGELFRAEIERAAAAAHPARREIHLEVGHAHERGRERRAAPRQCLETGNELAERERLREIVIGSHFEPPHAVVHRVEGGQHQYRGGDPSAPQLGAEL